MYTGFCSHLEPISERPLCFFELGCGERQTRVLMLSHVLQLHRYRVHSTHAGYVLGGGQQAFHLHLLQMVLLISCISR